MDLGPVLEGEQVGEPPTILERTDETCLFYAGKLHAIHGEPEAGKGWIAMRAVAEVVERGEHAVYIDFEDDAGTAVERLRALGVSDEPIADRFHYVRPKRIARGCRASRPRPGSGLQSGGRRD